MAGQTAKPTSPQAETAPTRSPSYELWIAFAVSISPQVLALLLGGYGRIITNAPLAVIVTIVVVVAIVIAYLQVRDDAHAERSSHWLVWATIVAGTVWVMYAFFVGIVIVLGQVFCVSQYCRGPIR
jgi:amino acid transporter